MDPLDDIELLRQYATSGSEAAFIVLARKAGRIPDQTVLSGWLFNTTRLTALAQIRAAIKRRRHEQEAQMEIETEPAETEPWWKQMSPLLDEALSTLREKDRRAVLLRFFENQSLAQVGHIWGQPAD